MNAGRAQPIVSGEYSAPPSAASQARATEKDDQASSKLFYLFTCEYCFSFYVTAVLLAITRFRLLYPDWRGYMISLFTLVWIANVYMSLFGRIRLDLKRERVEIEEEENEGRGQ